MSEHQFDPPVGIAETLSAGLQRVLAPNPTPMTFRGTNSYLLGDETLAVIDPGPNDPLHLQALKNAISGRPVSHIIITHSHLDHSPAAAPLARMTGAPVLAFGDSDAGKSPLMRELARAGLTEGGEGVDHDFAPDALVRDQQLIAGDNWTLEVLHTPGHMGNHIALRWGDQIFCGDLVMGWASSLVSPPDGDLGEFLTSCTRLRDLGPATLHSGHGAPVFEPVARMEWLIDHRNNRTDQILTVLASAPRTVAELTDAIYHDVPRAMHAAAARNVFAHLVHLIQTDAVDAAPELSFSAVFSRRN